MTALSRRAVVSTLTAAGGLAIGFKAKAAVSSARPLGDSLAAAEAAPVNEINPWLVIGPDNSVLVRLVHSEMGQGTATALAMLAAEELGCDWSKVKIEYASANRNLKSKNIYGGQMTVGSQGVRSSVKMMQQAGASARERLVAAAAKRWNVQSASCGCAGGKVTHKETGRALDYGALCADAAAITLAKEPDIKAPESFTLVGKWTPRLDTAPKLDGTAQFGIDAKVPGMVYAAVNSAPEWGAKLASVDEAPAKAMRGVIAVVKLDDAVAVVADRYWRAKAGLAALQPVWAPGANARMDSAQLDQAYRDAALNGPLINAKTVGTAPAADAGAKLVEAVYEVPYLAHAPMEPMNATVHIQPDRVDVWIGTQSPVNVLQAAARQTGVDPANVYVHNQFVGGGFGRRSNHDELTHAIAVAKVVGKPVKLIWSREQDIRRDHYRPQAAVAFRGTVKDAKAQSLETKVAVGSLLRSLNGPAAVPEGRIEPMAVEVLATHSYRIPYLNVGAQLKNAHVPVSFWRSVGASQNTFFLESFIDEMAHAAGQDPYQFRRAMLDRQDYLGVLDLMAEKGDWGKPLAPGAAGERRGRGMAIVDTYGTITGQVTEVTVGADGKLKVDRVVAVVDCYHAANPNTIEQQIEGGIVFGLTAALYGEISIRNGGPVQTNFNSYRLMRLSETPKIECYIKPSGGPRWGGIGEPSVAPAAPALTNAIFAATGKRVRKLPLKNVDLKAV